MIDLKKNWMQISQRQRMSPFPNYMSMECITRDMKKHVGVVYRDTVLILQENNFHVFIDKDDHIRVGKTVLKKVIANPNLFVQYEKRLKGYANSFYAFLKKNNNQKRLKTVSESRLAFLHEEYNRRYKQIYSLYFPILSVENYLFEYLQSYINKREHNFKKAARYIDTLITARRAMVNRQETISALKACERIKKNRSWMRLFQSKKAVQSIAKNKKLYQLIKNHERTWYWITRDYDDPVLTFEDFTLRFKRHLRRDPARALKKMYSEELELKKKITAIVKRLRIDKKHRRLFQTMREGIHYKEYRKSVVSQSLFLYDPILKEIARRAGLSLRQVRHIRVEEVRSLLAQTVDISHELNERIKLSVWHAQRGKAKVYVGKQAQKYFNSFVKINKDAKVLQGMAVSPGITKGPVKIVINPDAFHKVKKGDIIATLQATPVFTHVLSIASGLICDGGPGITSHPATLAREAGIPGIIGLRMATKILKDGQIVEVDGDKGIVKIKAERNLGELRSENIKCPRPSND